VAILPPKIIAEPDSAAPQGAETETPPDRRRFGPTDQMIAHTDSRSLDV